MAETPEDRAAAMEETVNEDGYPKGTLLFIFVFLILIVAFWVNTYVRLWLGWWR